MQGSPAATPASATAQLEQLRSAAAALAACTAVSPSPASPGAAPAGQQAAEADWEGRLAAVNAAIGAALRPGSAGSPRAGGSRGLAPHQAELVEAINSCAGNCVTFLPMGLGLRAVTGAVLSHAAARHPDRHVVVVVDRPAQALSHAQRLRAELGLPTAVFCGGDFLYSFPQQFQSSRVLVFTAGLLLRLLKTGVYRLEQASMMLLVDAFTVVRNHPSNTLVREYWKVAEEGRRPRVLGVLASQLPAKPRPFDRLRQNLRKLCHSLQARLLLPGGAGLARLEAQLHHDRIQLHSYALSPPEERLASLLQQHLLGLWDVLHEFGLNHFGRLVQFSSTAGPGGGGAAGTPPAPGSDPQALHGLGGGVGTPTPPRPLAAASPLSGAGSPAAEGSPATPLHGTPPAAGHHVGGNSAAAAAAEQPDPMQHDWAQVELQVLHSLWHSNALPSRGEHMREADALALMMHVGDCVGALRLLLEEGPGACLARLPAALRSLAAFLGEGLAARGPFGGGPVPPLKARILEVAAASPLLRWAQQRGQQPSTAQRQPQQGAGEAAVEQQAGQATAGSPQPAAGGGGGGEGVGPEVAAAAGCARSAALVELLQELREDRQLSGRQQRVAVVAASHGSVDALGRLLAGCQELAGMRVCLLRDAAQGEQEGSGAFVDTAPAPAGSGSGVGLGAALESDGSDDLASAVTAAGWLDAAASRLQSSEGEAAAGAAAAEAAVEGLPPPPPPATAGAEQAGAGAAAAAEPAAPAEAAPAPGMGSMEVHLLPASDLAELQQRIGAYHALVWYSAGAVLHASSQELESAALAACHRLSAAAAEAAAVGEGRTSDAGSASDGAASTPGHGRLECHVLASASQVLALGEVRRVDHSLKAAMQLVLLGDAAAEEKLTMLAHRNTATVLEPQARLVLDMLCLGLCGTAPALATMTASPAKPERGGRGRGGDEAGEGEAAAGPPLVLFQSSVTLPSAYFPPERFHMAGASMPLDVFVGPPLPSEQQASNAAALAALAALHRLGIIVRYWPSRLLLAQHLLPRSLQGQPAAGAGAGLGPPPQQQAAGAGADAAAGSSQAAEGAAAMAAAAAALAGSWPQAPSGGGGGGAATPPHVMNFFCPLCNVAATGHKAFDAHMRGFRHQRRIKQAELLQQGQEVSAMLQGLLLEDALPGGRAPPLAVGHPGLDLEEEEAGEYGSPSFADRQVYSPEPTAYRCDVCGVYCTSLRLLEAHTRGRKHQRRVAGLDSPGGPNHPGSPKIQPLVTPYFCGLCGLYATSEEQLRMHMLGKRHTRMVQLHRQRGAMLAGAATPPGAGAWQEPGASLQQQQHQLLTAAAAAAAAAAAGAGGAGWGFGAGGGAAEHESHSPLAAALAAGMEAGGPSPGLGTPSGYASPSLLAGPATLPGGGAGGDGWAAGELQAAVLQGMLLDAAGNQRIYRCDLCGVVTPSRRHYDYHLQGIKHTRRQLRAQGLDPGSASQPGTPASCGSPLGGSRSTSPARAARGRHSRHSSADWGPGGVGIAAAAMAAAAAEPPPESLICSVCGIMATSAVNLEDHYKGRRHQKNVERQAAQEAATAAAMAAAAAAAAGQLPPLPPNVSAVGGPFASTAAAAPGGGAPAAPPPQAPPALQRSTSGITLGADGLRLSGGALLSAGSLQRLPSGDVYDGFPCVRIGDVLLPSSMDLRAFLEEMQHLDEAEEEADQLPPIAEYLEVGGELEAFGSSTHLAASLPPASQPREQAAWAHGSGGGAGPAAASAGWGGSSGGGGGGGGAAHAGATSQRYPRQPSHGAGSSRSQPSSPSFQPSAGGGGGGYGRQGGRPGSAGPRLSRFAHDQQQAHQELQAAAAAGLGYGHQLGMPGGGGGFGMQAPGYAMHLGMQQQQQQQQQQQALMGQAAYGAGAGGYGVAPDYAAANAVLAAQQQAMMQQAMQMQQMQLAAAYGGAGMPAMPLGYGGVAQAQAAHQQQQQQQQGGSPHAFFPPPSLPSHQGRVPPLPRPNNRYQY